jgi:hypothetical protein
MGLTEYLTTILLPKPSQNPPLGGEIFTVTTLLTGVGLPSFVFLWVSFYLFTNLPGTCSIGIGTFS